MLRIRKNRGRPQVLLNGKLLLDDVTLVDPAMIKLLNLSQLRKLEKCTFSDLNDIGIELNKLFQLSALRYFTILPPLPHLEFLEKKEKKEKFTIEYYFFSELRDWKKPYSFAEYTQELLRISESRRIPNIECIRCDSGDEGEYDDSFIIKFSVLDPNVPIGAEIERTFQLVKDICSDAISVFLIRSATALTTVFDFPDEVETPCEQYLIYFVELLRQLGVHATSKLIHQTGQVLFTVYPPNGPHGLESGLETLEKLRTALELFIHLPSSTLEECESTQDRVTQQLLANIQHLRTQLALRRAVVQAEQVMIDPQLLSNDSVSRSLRLSTFGPPQERAELLGSLDCLTLDESNGLKVNLPKMYHWMKDLTQN